VETITLKIGNGTRTVVF